MLVVNTYYLYVSLLISCNFMSYKLLPMAIKGRIELLIF